jgi:hypothetical protein
MSKQNRADGQLFPFHFIINNALVAGTAAILANPNGLSPRGLVEADTWTHYRIRSLKFRLHPVSNTSTAYSACGWVPGVQDTTPSTRAQVAELMYCAVIGGIATVPTNWVNVSKSDLAGPLPWYKTIQGTADATEEAPGFLVVVGTAVETYVVEYFGVFEFKGSVATANTPMAVQLRDELRLFRQSKVDAREKQRMLTVLALSQSSGAGKV